MNRRGKETHFFAYAMSAGLCCCLSFARVCSTSLAREKEGKEGRNAWVISVHKVSWEIFLQDPLEKEKIFPFKSSYKRWNICAKCWKERSHRTFVIQSRHTWHILNFPSRYRRRSLCPAALPPLGEERRGKQWKGSSEATKFLAVLFKSGNARRRRRKK